MQTNFHNFFFFFTVKFRNELQRKLELELSPPLKSVAALPCKKLVCSCSRTSRSC